MNSVHTTDPQIGQLSPLAVRVKQACELIGIGRSKLYELIAAGEIETIKVGSATLIPINSLARFVESRRNAPS
jgi:excisionase family DNA binding protein